MADMKKMFYDTFLNSYVAEKETIAPPERYIETYRGSKGIYVESWWVKNKDIHSADKPLCLNVAYPAEEYYDEKAHDSTLEYMCNRDSVTPIRLRYFVLPEEKFDEYAERFGIDYD